MVPGDSAQQPHSPQSAQGGPQCSCEAPPQAGMHVCETAPLASQLLPMLAWVPQLATQSRALYDHFMFLSGVALAAAASH